MKAIPETDLDVIHVRNVDLVQIVNQIYPTDTRLFFVDQNLISQCFPFNTGTRASSLLCSASFDFREMTLVFFVYGFHPLAVVLYSDGRLEALRPTEN